MNQTPLPLSRIREIEKAGISAGLPLMQRADKAIADFVQRTIQPSGEILMLVGPGNNGGDALVAALALKQAGYAITVWMPIETNLPPDAREAREAWKHAGGEVTDRLPRHQPALVVDGLFGIGLNRSLGSPWQEAIDTVNQWKIPVLAIDIPSGLEADTGKHLGRPVQATWTLSFIAPTHALFSRCGKLMAGEIMIERLGLSTSAHSASGCASGAAR